MVEAMVWCAGDAAGGSVATLLLRVWRHWQITILLLVSATLQLTLVLAGFLRKRVLSRTFHGLLWLAFLGMEAASVYALGLMLASGCDHVFSLWAPLLLFHMGAADAINAYAPADNELWRRSAFKMLLSLLATAFILSRTHACERYMPAGILLAIVGTFKYAERVYCLRRGSTPEILVSARPIYNYMQDPSMQKGNLLDAGESPEDNLLVAGEWQWYKNKSNTAAHKCNVAVIYYKDIKRTVDSEFRDMPGKDHIKDLCLAYALFKIYRRHLSNLRIHSKEDDYQTVRRVLFGIKENLIKVIDLEMSFIFDGVFTKAAGDWLFQGMGLLTRLLSALLLLIALLVLAFVQAMQVGCSVSSKEHYLHKAGAHGPLQELTCILIVVGILVECLQIYRHVRCDSFRVWLVFTYITEKRRIEAAENVPASNGGSRPSSFSIMIHTLITKGILALLIYGSTVKKPTHWHYNVGQRSILQDILCKKVFMHCFVNFDIDGMRSTWKKMKDMKQLFKVDESELQTTLIERLIRRCERGSAEEVRKEVASRLREPFKEDNQQEDSFTGIEEVRKEEVASRLKEPFKEDNQQEDSFTGIEEVVLHWHVATSMCELDMLKDSKGKDELQKSKDPKLSIWLSRYCLYLMLKRHKLIPEDPDMAASLYARVKHDLSKDILLKLSSPSDPTSHKDILPKLSSPSEPTSHKRSNVADIEGPLLQKVEEQGASTSTSAPEPNNLRDLHLALRHAHKLLANDERWKTLADVWVDIVIYIAATENATPHTEQMAKGGELLTLLWVVIGHLGISQNV